MNSIQKLLKKNQTIIEPNKNFAFKNLLEVINFKDLIFLFIKRDFTVFYKQTILGPLWYIIQPLLNTIVFTIIFGNFAKIPTDGVAPFLFYLAGNVVWSYFSTCVNNTGNTFTTNYQIFSKVYFPRIIIPLSNIIFSMLQFFIQFTLFLLFLAYFKIQGADINLNFNVLYVPLLLLHLAVLSLGVGTLISALCSKYRDLSLAIGFGIQLWMFATPIIYPLSTVPEKYQFLSSLNPVTSIVESFRFIFLGDNSISLEIILTSMITTIIILILGISSFQKVEKNFIDTV